MHDLCCSLLNLDQNPLTIHRASTTSRVLVIGYGNTDRQDDGVAWHVLQSLSDRLSLPIRTNTEEIPLDEENHALLFQLQLTPEIVEAFIPYQRVIFIDAQTGDCEQGVQIKNIHRVYQASTLTHHLTPEACMALLGVVYGKPSSGVLVSIQGHKFGFGDDLSPQTAQLAQQAVAAVEKLMLINLSTDEVMI